MLFRFVYKLGVKLAAKAGLYSRGFYKYLKIVLKVTLIVFAKQRFVLLDLGYGNS